VLLLNGRFSVFDKTSGAKVQSMTDTAFWTNAGVNLAAGAVVTDPRVIYDWPSGHWFASQIDFIPGNEISNRFLLAVSSSSNPSAPWKAFAWMADPAGTFADFPRLGVDSKGVYL